MKHRMTTDSTRNMYLITPKAYRGDGTKLKTSYCDWYRRCHTVMATSEKTKASVTILPVSLSLRAMLTSDNSALKTKGN